MATILPFPAPRGGDWTPSERAGLDELAGRFAGEAGIEVAFGRSDAGDPWCVVLDASDEVLVHVAREGGSFVAHTADDLFVRSADLRTAVERVLGTRWQDERNDVVVPFAAAGRSVQVVTAVLVVASFVHHYRAEAEPTEDWSFAAARPLKPGAPREGRDEAAKAAAAIDAMPGVDFQAAIDPLQRATDETSVSPLENGGPIDVGVPDTAVQNAAEAPGLALADRLVDLSAAITGSLEADVLIGTDGDDLIDARTAPPHMHDLVDGGAGSDVIIVDGGTIAIGGPGADIFAIRAPESPGSATLLGVLVDFDPGVDLVVSADRGSGPPPVAVVGIAPIANIFDDPGVNLEAPAPALPGNRLTLDLDSDGVADGYLLVNGVLPDRAVVEAVHQLFAPTGGSDAAPPMPLPEPYFAPAAPVEPLHALLPELI